MFNSIITLIACLAITCILEEGFAIIMGRCSKKLLLLVFLANIITNPAANLVYWFAGKYLDKIILVIIIEVIVVVAEWRCYSGFGREIAHPFIFSLGANLVSYVAGSIVLLIIRGNL